MMPIATVSADFLRTFEASKRVGKVSERVFTDFMAEKAPGAVVEDLSEVLEFQWKDVDYRVTYPDGRVRLVEVKGDTNSRTKNFAIETVANEELQRPGWLWSSEADVVCYHFQRGLDSGDPNLYFLDMEVLRAFVRSEGSLRAYRVAPESRVHGGGMKTMSGVLVPRDRISWLSAHFVPVRR